MTDNAPGLLECPFCGDDDPLDDGMPEASLGVCCGGTGCPIEGVVLTRRDWNTRTSTLKSQPGDRAGVRDGKPLHEIKAPGEYEPFNLTAPQAALAPAGAEPIDENTQVWQTLQARQDATAGAEGEPLLPCDFTIGACTFKAGTPVRLAQDKAQRQYEHIAQYLSTPPQAADEV